MPAAEATAVTIGCSWKANSGSATNAKARTLLLRSRKNAAAGPITMPAKRAMLPPTGLGTTNSPTQHTP